MKGGHYPYEEQPTLTETPTSKLPSKRYAKILNAPAPAKKRAVPIGQVQAGHRPGMMSNPAGKD